MSLRQALVLRKNELARYKARRFRAEKRRELTETQYHRGVLRPPGPPPPGFVRKLRDYALFAKAPLRIIGDRFERYGDIYYTHNDGVGLYVLRHPDHIHQVLATDASSYSKGHSAFGRLSRVLGKDGLLTLDGDDWKRHRRMLGPAFQPRKMGDYCEVVVEEALAATNRWSAGQELDVGAAMTELTLRIVSRALFSHDVGAEIDKISGVMSKLQESPLALLLPRWVPSRARKQLEQSAAELDVVIYRLIRQRQKTNEPDKQDLLQALVNAVDEDGDGARLTESEVRDELMTLFLAGHETTSNALTWAWHLLSTHPRVAQRLHQELEDVLGDRPPCFHDLEKLTYTGQVMQEAMRLYPPAPAIVRRAAKTTRIADYSIPEGSEVAMWIYFLHHDARWFPSPEEFRPERFDGESASKRLKTSYLPFGAGPRACIGKHLAIMEANIILATLAQRFSMHGTTDAPLEPRIRITLAPARPVRLRLTAR